MMKAPYLNLRHCLFDKHYAAICGEILSFELEQGSFEIRLVEGGSGFQPRKKQISSFDFFAAGSRSHIDEKIRKFWY